MEIICIKNSSSDFLDVSAAFLTIDTRLVDGVECEKRVGKAEREEGRGYGDAVAVTQLLSATRSKNVLCWNDLGSWGCGWFDKRSACTAGWPL